MRLVHDLVHNKTIGPMGFFGAPKFEGKAARGSDENQFAGLKDDAFISRGNCNDLMIGNRDHGFLLEKESLVIQDDTLIGDTDKTGTGAFAIVNGVQSFARYISRHLCSSGE